MQTKVEGWLSELEGTALSLLGRVGTWCAPAVPAVLLARSSSMVFRLDGWLAWVVAVIIAISVELIGLEAVHAWARAKHWNHERDKELDEPSNERKASSFIGYYLLVSEAFVVGFAWYIGITSGWWWEMLGALFPPFSYLAAQLMIERDTHNLRVRIRNERLAEQKAEKEIRKIERREARMNMGVHREQTVNKGERAMLALIDFWSNGGGSYRDAASSVGMSLGWVHDKTRELEAQGRIRRNGKGVEVL